MVKCSTAMFGIDGCGDPGAVRAGGYVTGAPAILRITSVEECRRSGAA